MHWVIGLAINGIMATFQEYILFAPSFIQNSYTESYKQFRNFIRKIINKFLRSFSNHKSYSSHNCHIHTLDSAAMIMMAVVHRM